MRHHNITAVAVGAVACVLLAAWTLGCDSSSRDTKDEEDTKPPRRRKLDKPKGYIPTIVRTKKFADTRTCLARMAILKQELQLYAEMNDGKFPASLAELKRPRLIRTPMRGNEEYSYIPGQSTNRDPANILVYLEEVDHKGKCHILRIGGTVEAVTPDDLEAELRKTRARLKGR